MKPHDPPVPDFGAYDPRVASAVIAAWRECRTHRHDLCLACALAMAQRAVNEALHAATTTETGTTTPVSPTEAAK